MSGASRGMAFRLFAMWLAIGALLFVLAGRLDLPRLWAYVAVFLGTMSWGVLRIDPELAKERWKPGGKGIDPLRLALIRLAALATFVVAAVDIGRFHWSDTVPLEVSLVALPVVAAGFWFSLWAISVNRFFSPVIRVQAERGHHVVTDGPYRLVRHPGYAGIVVGVPASALAIGSWWALLPALLFAVLVASRAAGEDRFLRANLEGYAHFAQRTRFRLVPGVWAAVLLAVSTVPAAAQQDTTQQRPRPFVEGGTWDRPYLTRLLGRTAIGGYAEAHARWERADGVTDEAGFQLRRWNIFTATQVSDFVRIGTELEFEEGGEEITIEYAAMDIGIHPALSIRAGIILSPLGRFNLSHDSPRNEFTDRPLVSTELLGVALSEPGLGLFGLIGLGGPSRITYELYATNGFHSGLITDSPDGTRVALGKRNWEDNNASPALVGRVAWSPRVGYEIGVSAHHGAYNVYLDEGNQVDERRDVSIAVLDAEARLMGFQLRGEAAVVDVDVPPGLVGIYASGQRGLYVEAMRPFWHARVTTMPNSFFALGARLDLVDFDTGIPGDLMRRFTVGLNFRTTQDTAVKLNWARGQSRDRFNNPSEEAGLLFSVATYF